MIDEDMKMGVSIMFRRRVFPYRHTAYITCMTHLFLLGWKGSRLTQAQILEPWCVLFERALMWRHQTDLQMYVPVAVMFTLLHFR